MFDQHEQEYRIVQSVFQQFQVESDKRAEKQLVQEIEQERNLMVLNLLN